MKLRAAAIKMFAEALVDAVRAVEPPQIKVDQAQAHATKLECDSSVSACLWACTVQPNQTPVGGAADGRVASTSTAWECGVDRICVPETLQHGIHEESKTFKDHNKFVSSGAINVYTHDNWEQYKIRFSVFDPLY